MTRLIKLQMGEDEAFMESFEDSTSTGGRVTPAGNLDHFKIENILAALKPFTESVSKSISDLPIKKKTIEIGLSVNFEGTLVFVKGGSEATIKLTLEM